MDWAIIFRQRNNKEATLVQFYAGEFFLFIHQFTLYFLRTIEPDKSYLEKCKKNVRKILTGGKCHSINPY